MLQGYGFKLLLVSLILKFSIVGFENSRVKLFPSLSALLNVTEFPDVEDDDVEDDEVDEELVDEVAVATLLQTDFPGLQSLIETPG